MSSIYYVEIDGQPVNVGQVQEFRDQVHSINQHVARIYRYWHPYQELWVYFAVDHCTDCEYFEVYGIEPSDENHDAETWYKPTMLLGRGADGASWYDAMTKWVLPMLSERGG